MSAASEHRRVACPGCGQPAVFSAANRYRPFCSERCKSGDLGAWASERYRVADLRPGDAPDAAAPHDVDPS